MSATRPGLLIVFEGTDGTGKTSQRDLLAANLAQRGLPVEITKEPTDGHYGQQIRQLYGGKHRFSLEEELELFLADRRQHVAERLLPALAAGRIVLCDRYYFSTAAYQGARGLDPQTIVSLNDFAPVPDLVLLFRAEIEVCLKRITEGRGETPNSFEQGEFLARVAAIYATFDASYIRTIDAQRSVDEVQRAVIAAVEPLLPKTDDPGQGERP
jgi:dTMP kinase